MDPYLGIVVASCVIFLAIGISFYSAASDCRKDLNAKIEQVDAYHRENAADISFATFFRDNYPTKYREWTTGSWPKEQALRDSVVHAAKMSRLRRLAEK